ncbi:MAG TPA: hypothetical protein VGQ65_15210 [Thermoanaerobaculia bacterium]|jgi:hypothetical protein|nr:hypothetical protein [Thermoanaerobaculia bacterium]
MSLNEKIGCATLIATLLCAIAAWLVVPGVLPQKHERSDGAHVPQSGAARRTAEDSLPTTSSTRTITVPSKYSVKLPTQYTVRIEYCKRDGFNIIDGGTNVTCAASATNDASTDGEATLVCDNINGVNMATLVDSDGKAHRALRCSIGGKEVSYPSSFKMSPEIKYRIEIVYVGVPSVAVNASLIEFHLDDRTRRNYSNDHDVVRFTNVPILE